MNWCRVLLLATICAVEGSGAIAAEPADSVKKEDVAVTGKAPAKAPIPTARGPADRLDLEATVVTGSRELPKVLYIVPWKKAELRDLPEQPFNSLLDEALMPIDRDEFRREVSYFSKLVERPASAPAGPEATAVQPTVP